MQTEWNVKSPFFSSGLGWWWWVWGAHSMVSAKHEPGHRIPYKIAYAFSEDSDQPAHSRMMVRIFAVLFITKTCVYNFDPLKPHFYLVKLGFTGVYIIFLISAQKHRLWVLVRTASPRRFWRVPIIYDLSRTMKNIRNFYLKIFIFWW